MQMSYFTTKRQLKAPMVQLFSPVKYLLAISEVTVLVFSAGPRRQKFI